MKRHAVIAALMCAASSCALTSCASDDGYTSNNEIAASTDKQQALKVAQGYVDQIAISEQGVRNVLEHDKYSADAVYYAVKNVDANYDEEAKQSMENYRDDLEMNRSETEQVLLDEGFDENNVAYAMQHY